MKVLFWIQAIILLIAEIYCVQAFINIYFKNYNGGRQSSSGSIVYYAVLGIVLLAAGFFFYFRNQLKLATLIMGLPILLVVLYLFVMLVLPYIMGERMN